MAIRMFALNVGQGDSTLLRFSDGGCTLIDTHFVGEYATVWTEGVLPLLPTDDQGRKVLRHLIITHPHDDHIGGIGKLKESGVIVQNVWESGHRLYYPKDSNHPHYHAMLDLFAQVKRNGGTVRTLTAQSAPYTGPDGVVEWYCFSPSRYYIEAHKPSEQDIHTQCMVLKMVYGSQSVLFAGDSNAESWIDRIVPFYGGESTEDVNNLLRSNILHASHHGSRTFFQREDGKDDELHEEAIARISPDVTVISVGEENVYGHPHSEALALYEEYSYHAEGVNPQVFETDDVGTIVITLYKDYYELMPEEHFRVLRKGLFILTDKMWISPNPEPDEDGTYPMETSITFTLKGKPSSDQAIGRVIFDVQNNGLGDHQRVHNHYLGQNSESPTYRNRTAYHGTHNLFVCVKNTRGKIIAKFVHRVRVREEE